MNVGKLDNKLPYKELEQQVNDLKKEIETLKKEKKIAEDIHIHSERGWDNLVEALSLAYRAAIPGGNSLTTPYRNMISQIEKVAIHYRAFSDGLIIGLNKDQKNKRGK